MNSDLIFKIVDFSNIKYAIKTQKEIFHNEDGTLNLLASIDRNLFMNITGLFYVDDKIKYYLAYQNEKIIGITGLYSYVDTFPEDCWLGWYGVYPENRGQGLGTQILNWTINKARESAYKTIRLYTDIKGNGEAINLYKKFGFIGEKYNAEELVYDCYIYSKSLIGKNTILWNNKKLDLSYQSELDHFDENKIKEIMDKYDSYINDL